MRPEDRIGVEVPASAANLGPGFDAFAVALGVHLVAWTDDAGARRVVCDGEGHDELPSDERNLVWRGFAGFCAHAGVPVPDLTIVTRNDIPLERGLGSSAAAAVAGAALGRAVTGARASDADLVAICAELDGHADNAAAAVLGGVVVVESGRARRLEPSRALTPLLLVPDGRQSTHASRATLPSTVGLADAAANGARAALVLAGITGACAWDPSVLRDVLHEPCRLAAMPASGGVVSRLRAAGLGACLSGSGPSVLALLAPADPDASAVRRIAGPGWRALAPGWDRAGAAVCPPSSSLPRSAG